jgi:signal transduction histidine kinase/CheY-like chemotaxis protein
VRGEVLPQRSGEPRRSVGTVVDITAEATARLQQLAQQRLLDGIAAALPLHVFVFDLPTRRVVYANRPLGLLLGDADAVFDGGRAFVERLHAEDRPLLPVWEARVATLQPGEVDTQEVRVRDERGAWRWMRCRFTPLTRAIDGAGSQVVGTIEDVTEQVALADARVRLESRMQQAQKLDSLGLLAGGIAHDFNNLLVGVLSNASLALLDLEDPSPTRAVVLEIERTAQRAADLTRQLLAYSGKGRFVVEPIALSALAAEMAQLLHTVVHKDARITLDLDDALPLIEGDATQLRQVVMNLITNASDALLGRPGEITVRTRRASELPLSPSARRFVSDAEPAGECAALEISDSGCGMNEQTTERMFDPFFSTKFTGRGLGLAATLGIVRGHRGDIRVETEPGRGTRFVMRFPVAPARRPHDTPSRSLTPVTQRGRVLVVDDDGVVRSVTTALLTRRGFDVTAVSSGREALTWLMVPPDDLRCVLLDLTMPGLTGVETLHQLREQERAEGSAPRTVFLMSGYSEQEVAGSIGELGVAGFLQKPFTMADLDALLTALPDA